MEVSFRALRLNANNISSDIAVNDIVVNDLDGENVDFAPYSGMTTPEGKKLVALYETTDEKGDGKKLSELVELVELEGVNGSVTFYLEGRFIDIEKEKYDPAEYKKLGYKELGYYKFVNGSYVPVTVTETPGGEGGESVKTSDATHVYVYLASYTLKADELTWDHSGISYNYNGGVKRTSVTIAHGAMKGTIQMPVNIVDGKINELYFKNEAEDATAPGYSKYFNKENATGSAYFATHWIDDEDGKYGKQLVFDPFEGLDIDAFAKVEDEEGKLVDADYYLYFPTKVGFKTADGYIVDGVSVTWSNLAGIRDTYRGGYYNVRLTVAAQGEYTPEGETEPSYAVAAQGFTAEEFVKVESRKVIEGTDSSSFGLQAEMADGSAPFMTASNPLSVGWADRAGLGTGTFIDPYSFDIAAFRTAAESITTVKVMVNGIDDPVYYGTNGIGGVDKATQGYTLAWNFTGMSVNYLGGRVALIAQLTGPDGSMQEYEIDYLVQRKLATTLEGTKGGAGNVKGYTVGYDLNNSAEFGVARPDGGGSYEIDPYNPFTRTLPTGWKIGVKVWNATLENGNVKWSDKPSDEELTESYLTATMPSNANLTIEKIQKGGAAGEASLQITGGQRIRIPVRIKSVNISDQSAPDTSKLHTNRVLNGSTKFTIEGQEVTVLIAWHGTVTVTYNDNGDRKDTATYKVTFVNPTGGTVTAPDIPGRTVKYNLIPYIGAIVDTAGRVVMDGDVPAHQLVGTPYDET